jgi:hypothetical protein
MGVYTITISGETDRRDDVLAAAHSAVSVVRGVDPAATLDVCDDTGFRLTQLSRGALSIWSET